MIVDRTGEPIAPTISEPDDEPPTWATDPNEPLPLEYERVSDHCDRFYLGKPGRRAVAMVEPAAWRTQAEVLVTLAAGAWHAMTAQHCTREMAELIAKGWIRCVEVTRS